MVRSYHSRMEVQGLTKKFRENAFLPNGLEMVHGGGEPFGTATGACITPRCLPKGSHHLQAVREKSVSPELLRCP